jgi:hypothetical protein
LGQEKESLPEKVQGVSVEMLQEFAQVERGADIQIEAPALIVVKVMEGPLTELMTEPEPGHRGGNPCCGFPASRSFGKKSNVIVAGVEGEAHLVPVAGKKMTATVSGQDFFGRPADQFG